VAEAEQAAQPQGAGAEPGAGLPPVDERDGAVLAKTRAEAKAGNEARSPRRATATQE
jgi:hypothetical protein